MKNISLSIRTIFNRDTVLFDNPPTHKRSKQFAHALIDVQKVWC